MLRDFAAQLPNLQTYTVQQVISLFTDTLLSVGNEKYVEALQLLHE
jgi:hypothetical protein